MFYFLIHFFVVLGIEPGPPLGKAMLYHWVPIYLVAFITLFFPFVAAVMTGDPTHLVGHVCCVWSVLYTVIVMIG